jgi:hypothetical protein
MGLLVCISSFVKVGAWYEFCCPICCLMPMLFLSDMFVASLQCWYYDVLYPLCEQCLCVELNVCAMWYGFRFSRGRCCWYGVCTLGYCMYVHVTLHTLGFSHRLIKFMCAFNFSLWDVMCFDNLLIPLNMRKAMKLHVSTQRACIFRSSSLTVGHHLYLFKFNSQYRFGQGDEYDYSRRKLIITLITYYISWCTSTIIIKK